MVNPFATRVSDVRLAAVEAELRRVAELTVVKTEHPRHATELVRSACSGGCEAVIVFSGDGGYNEALNGLDADVPIGFLPGGGTSVLPRALGFPADPVASARRLAASIELGRTRRISLGRVNGRRFAFNAGIGLDAAEADFELGLDFVAPVHIRRRSLVRVATALLTGHARSGPVLYGHDLDRLEVVCDTPMPLQADGEDLGDVESAVFEAERGAVSVLV